MPNLASKEICTGCTACYSICPVHCIEMKKDENGFAFPYIGENSRCINCGRCESVCPVLKEISWGQNQPAAYAAMSDDEAMRMESSSGGIFTELAREIIGQGGVVYGAAYDETFTVKHCCATNEEELQKFRGAKYAQSDLADTFSEIIYRLDQGQKVLFSGTPCQVGGLKALAGDDENLFCVDFVCHSVPSPKAWKEYVRYRAQKDNNGEYPVSINLRSKNTGWSRYKYSNVFEYENGVQHSAASSQSLYMKLFVGGYISRTSCENCNFKGYNRLSDFTIGDFWGIWDIDSGMDDNKGTSVVLVHSEKAQKIWNNINSSIKFKEVSLQQASQQNTAMLVSFKANPDRDLALRKIQEGKIEECEELFVGVNTSKPSLASRIKNKVKKLINLK